MTSEAIKNRMLQQHELILEVLLEIENFFADDTMGKSDAAWTQALVHSLVNHLVLGTDLV